MDGQQISGKHKDYSPNCRRQGGDLHVAQKCICGQGREYKMENDKPVPYDVKRKKKVENMGRIEHTRLKRCEERDTRIIIRVPKWEYKAFYLRNPEKLGRDKKRCKVSFTKNNLG
jgi:hypothetical protein